MEVGEVASCAETGKDRKKLKAKEGDRFGRDRKGKEKIKQARKKRRKRVQR